MKALAIPKRAHCSLKTSQYNNTWGWPINRSKHVVQSSSNKLLCWRGLLIIVYLSTSWCPYTKIIKAFRWSVSGWRFEPFVLDRLAFGFGACQPRCTSAFIEPYVLLRPLFFPAFFYFFHSFLPSVFSSTCSLFLYCLLSFLSFCVYYYFFYLFPTFHPHPFFLFCSIFF